MPFSQYLGQLPDNITRVSAREVMHRVLTDTSVSDADLSALLTALAARTITANELAGFADAMRALSIPLPFTDAERSTLVDTCGTGGDDSGTFNISTAAALVAAAAGAKSPNTATAASPPAAVLPTSSKLSAFPSRSHPTSPSPACAPPDSPSSTLPPFTPR